MNVEHEVADMLRRETEVVRVQPVPWSQLENRAARIRRTRWIAGGVSLAAAVAAVMIAASGLRVEGDERVQVTDGSHVSDPTPSTTTTPPLPGTTLPTAPAVPPTAVSLPSTQPTTVLPPATTTTTVPPLPDLVPPTDFTMRVLECGRYGRPSTCVLEGFARDTNEGETNYVTWVYVDDVMEFSSFPWHATSPIGDMLQVFGPVNGNAGEAMLSEGKTTCFQVTARREIDEFSAPSARQCFTWSDGAPRALNP